MSPKSSRDVELMNAVTEMSEDRLNVFENSDVVISAAVSFIVL